MPKFVQQPIFVATPQNDVCLSASQSPAPSPIRTSPNQPTDRRNQRPPKSIARKPSYQLIDDQAISILDSRMNHDGQQQSYRVQVTLATHHFLTSIIATRPPFSVVFTDWLSMIAALGVGLLPSDCRTLGRSASWTPSQFRPGPSAEVFVHCLPGWEIVGKHTPRASGTQPYTMPLTTSRISTVRGPSRLGWRE